jgi:nitroreductase
MNTLDAIRERRAVKSYDASYSVSPEQERQLLELAMQSPSSFNIQHWRLVKISDPALRKQIRQLAFDQSQVTDASLLYILTADMMAWKKSPERYWKNAPAEAQKILVPWITPFYEGNPQLQRDEAMRSVGLFAQTLMIAAKALNLDSCPMIGFEIEKVAELIKLPEDHVIGMMIVVGKALQPAWPKPGFLSLDEVLFENHF